MYSTQRLQVVSFSGYDGHAGVQREFGYLTHRIHEGVFWIAGGQNVKRERLLPGLGATAMR